MLVILLCKSHYMTLGRDGQQENLGPSIWDCQNHEVERGALHLLQCCTIHILCQRHLNQMLLVL